MILIITYYLSKKHDLHLGHMTARQPWRCMSLACILVMAFSFLLGPWENMQDPVGLPRTRGCSDFGSCEARRNTVTLNGDRSPNPAFSGDEDPFTNYFDVHLGVQGFEPYPSDPLVDDSTRWLHHVGHRNRQASPRLVKPGARTC